MHCADLSVLQGVRRGKHPVNTLQIWAFGERPNRQMFGRTISQPKWTAGKKKKKRKQTLQNAKLHSSQSALTIFTHYAASNKPPMLWPDMVQEKGCSLAPPAPFLTYQASCPDKSLVWIWGPTFLFFQPPFFFFFSCQRGSPLTADSSVVLDLAAGFPAPLLNQLTKLSPIRVQNVLCSAQCIKGCSVGWTFGKHLANSGVWRIAELADVRPNLCSGRTVPQPKWTAGNHTN